MRRRLTDTMIERLKPKATGRYLVYDSKMPSLAVRVSSSGRKTFCVVARFNGAKHPTRRSLGTCGLVTVDEARNRARNLPSQEAHGADVSFAALCAQFFVHIRQQRRSWDVERSINRDLLPLWRDRPISSISKADVIKAMDAIVGRGAPYSAHLLFAYLRRMFNWAIARGIIEHSPCDRVKPKDIIGPKAIRQRVLSDDEIRRLWAAGTRMGHPYGPLWQLLLLTGARKSELSGARWVELDEVKALLVVPPERFKSNATHMVPLSPMAVDLINTLPRDGEYLFGRINGFSKAKRRLDRFMGDVPHFVIHDIRRTVRTRLSSLRVPEHVAEMVIGHGRKGLARVYDQHHYLDEMRDALQLWEQALAQLVQDFA